MNTDRNNKNKRMMVGGEEISIGVRCGWKVIRARLRVGTLDLCQMNHIEMESNVAGK